MTWEWYPDARIRSYLYPLYLSIPLRIINFLGLDYSSTVRASYYLAQWVLVIIGDYFYYQIGCTMIGENATRLSMYLYISNKFYNIHLIRCFGNSVEAIIYLVAFHFYNKITYKFDKNIIIFSSLITVSFMMRPTSPIGFIFLVIYKIFKENSILSFILTGLTFVIPILFCIISLETYYYN